MSTNELIENTNFVHREHLEWLSQLNFYQDEIKFFQNELVLVLHKHRNSFSMVENVDEYRDIFLKKLQHIDEIRHEIVLHEKKLSEEAQSDSDDLFHHQAIRDRFNQFISDFEILKKNFKRFAAHHD